MKKFFFLLPLLLLVSAIANSTHLRSGSITYQKVSDLTYQITVSVVKDTGSEVQFGDGFLDFGDGSQPFQLPQIEGQPSPDLGPGSLYASFTINHTFPSSGNYLINYVEPNRNEGIINMDNSVNTTFFTETLLIIDSTTLSDNSSPILLSPPVFFQNYNDDMSLSLAAMDLNDYKLRYKLVTPKREKNEYVDGYEMPKGVKLDPISGLMTWSKEEIQNQAHLGEYAFAVRISQYQLTDGDYRLRGYLIYDFQVILQEMEGSLNVNLGSSSSLVSENVFLIPSQESDTIRYDISSLGAEVSADVYSELTSENLQWEVLGAGPDKQVELIVNITEELARTNPYIINIRLSDPTYGSKHDVNLRIYTEAVEYPDFITSLPEEISVKKFTIFPNPAQNKIYFKASGSVKGFKIFTSTGRLVSAGEAVDSIDITHLNAGQYIFIIGGEAFNIIKQ